MKVFITSVILLITSFIFSQENTTSELDGVEISYKYSGGNNYNIKFIDGKISYRFLTGSRPEKRWGPFAYKASKTENNKYFLSWYEESYEDFVTLLLNPTKKTLFGSALIVKKDKNLLHFQKAVITEYKK